MHNKPREKKQYTAYMSGAEQVKIWASIIIFYISD